MKRIKNILAYMVLGIGSAIMAASCHSDDDATPATISTKRERNSIKEGNDLYGKQRYAEA